MAAMFSVNLAEPLESVSTLPGPSPDDDANDLDLLFFRYFHDHNRRVFVRLGSDELEAELDYDIRSMIVSLPLMVRRIELGQQEKLSFSERGYEVIFTPEEGTIKCQIHRWGAKGEEPSVSCDREQVIRELWCFLERLARGAVDRGYLTEKQAEEFLGRALP